MNSIGVDFKLKNITLEEKNIKLQIVIKHLNLILKWDTAGQERFRTITTSYYKGAQAIIIVYDITDKESFEHVRNWMLDIDKYWPNYFIFRFAKEGVLRFLVGNKCDLEHKRQVTYDQGKDLAKQYNIQFLETSAKDTVNIDELFVSCAKNFLEKQNSNVVDRRSASTPPNKKEKPTQKGKVINIDKLNTKKSGGCCGGSSKNQK